MPRPLASQSRPILRRLRLLACLVLIAPLADAAPRALIVTGLSTGESQAARLAAVAATLREGFVARGFAPDAVVSLAHSPSAPLRRDAVLASLAGGDDETWLVLLGTAAPARDGQPAFQVAGPRLAAAELAAAVGKLPGKKFVVVATSASGGFLPPLLALPDVEAVSATAEAGEISEPRFAEFWAEALVAKPSASFAELAAAAAERVAAFYESGSLAQGENARLIDRSTGKILAAPFPAGLAASPAAAPSRFASPGPVDIASLSIPKPAGDNEVETRPADGDSLAVLAAARDAARDSAHAALILRTEIEIVVARDFSGRETWRTRAYARTGEALDDLGTLHLPSDPPFVSARLLAARVIRPDGSQRLLNPAARAARLAAETQAERERPSSEPRALPPASPSFIELPDVTADCVIEAEWTIDRRADGSLPEFSDEWHLARAYPQKSLRVTVAAPDEPRWHVFSKNLPAPETTSSGARVWTLADLPAREPLPGDPPAREFTPWIGVSSVANWDAFAAWYRRLASGSDTAGPGVEALAAEIAAAHPDRAGRLRAAYERVAALRYVAIELGVGAFRPRTPEQVWRQRFGDCKDKANLLVAVLAKLGIEAEFALVNRFDVTFHDFPSWQFNHALARVPAAPADGQPHDLWLDTTDRLVPYGIVAPGDLGRHALVFSRDFARAGFHEITAAQEPPAVWTEHYARPSDAAAGWRVEISALGAAEVRLRHLLLGLSPAQRAARMGELLGRPVASVEAPDAYDLSAPYRVVLRAADVPAAPTPLLPGLRAHLAPSDRPRVWDEGRAWTYSRVTPEGVSTEAIPARLP